jgi:hypothetical protein
VDLYNVDPHNKESTMKITVGKLLEASQHLGKLFAADVKVTTAFSIKRNISAINIVLADFEASKKQLIEKYADRDDNNELVVVSKSYTFAKHMQVFSAEMGALLSTEVEVELTKIRISSLEKVEVSASAIASYDFMLEE